MTRILKHPILDIPCNKETSFKYNGTVVKGMEGFTIAAALHQAGYPVHTHSLDNRNRSLECGIGKCGACEMLVDGVVSDVYLDVFNWQRVFYCRMVNTPSDMVCRISYVSDAVNCLVVGEYGDARCAFNTCNTCFTSLNELGGY